MTRARFTYRLTMAFLYVTMALTVGALFFARLSVHSERLDLGSMVYGTAHRPYAGRALVPAIVRAVASVSGPDSTRSRSPVARFGTRVLHDIGAEDQAPRLSYEYGILFLLSFLCLLGFALLLRALTRVNYPAYPQFVADLAPPLALAIVPLVFFREWNLVYDPMTLFSFTLCVYLIARRSHVAYLLAFPFAVLNKETAILLPFIFLLRESGLSSRRRAVASAAFQLAVFAAVRLGLGYVLKDRPGSLVEVHLGYNLALLSGPGIYLKTLPAVVPLWVLVAYGWRAKALFLRRSLVLTAVPLVATSVTSSVLGELRAFYEVYCFVYLLALPTVMEVFAVKQS